MGVGKVWFSKLGNPDTMAEEKAGESDPNTKGSSGVRLAGRMEAEIWDVVETEN